MATVRGRGPLSRGAANGGLTMIRNGPITPRGTEREEAAPVQHGDEAAGSLTQEELDMCWQAFQTFDKNGQWSGCSVVRQPHQHAPPTHT